jgi:hypothetical protein
MASLKDLIVMGPARFLDKLYGNLEGNATSADKLKTARNINGTSFDGSTNITTANWGTARTLTIGNKGQSVNGSQAYSWSLNDIGAVAKSGDTMTGDLKFTTNGLHFIPGDTNQYLWKVYGSTDGSYGFRLQYNGASSGNDNSLSLIADNQQGTEVNAFTMLQDGTIILTVNPQFKTTNYTSTPISLLDDGTNYGHTMLIGAGGTTYIGAGESASGLYSKLGVKSTEDLILGADSSIKFHTNADNATATNGVTLNTSNYFYPQTTDTGSIGTSGNKWKEAYFSNMVTAGKGFTVDGTMSAYPSNSNELNFGGSNNSSTIYFGYRAIDSKPIPTKFVFGSSGGTASLQCNTVYLGSGTSSYVSSSQYTGNSATATSASKLAINNSASLADCLQYIQTSSQTSGNDLPPHSSWWHVLKMNHGTGDTYYKRLLAFDFFSHKIKTNYAEGNGAIKGWRSVLDSESGVARAHYSTTDSGSAYILVTINKETGWMLNFTLRLYQSYVATDIQISGYNYGGSYWYSPDAVVLGSTSSSAQTIYFGYTGAYKLWVAVPASNYTGADVFGATNGYTQIDDLSEAFTITRVSSLPGTTQSTLTRYRPWYRDETVSNATYAASAGSVAWGNISGKPSFNYLPLAGGTMNAGSQIIRAGQSKSWISGRDGALLRINTLSGYSPAISIKTNNGSWDIGAYDNSSYTDKLIFSFATDANYSAGNNSTVQYMIDKNGYFSGTCSYASSAGSANSVAWGNVTGKPSTFNPSSHTHSYLPLSGGSMTGAISITTSGVTNSFYSQNSSYTHYSTTASVGHWFNKSVYVQGEIYAGSSYNKRVYHMGNIVYGSEPTSPAVGTIWLIPV